MARFAINQTTYYEDGSATIGEEIDGFVSRVDAFAAAVDRAMELAGVSTDDYRAPAVTIVPDETGRHLAVKVGDGSESEYILLSVHQTSWDRVAPVGLAGRGYVVARV